MHHTPQAYDPRENRAISTAETQRKAEKLKPLHTDRAQCPRYIAWTLVTSSVVRCSPGEKKRTALF